MEKIKTSLEGQLNLMDRYRLTSEEYLTIELLFLAIESNSLDPLVNYFGNTQIPKNVGLIDILFSLQDKGIILKSCKFERGTPLDIETVQFNENFLRNYRKASGDLGQELFEAYPNEAIINGVVWPMRNYAKKYNNEDEFYFAYGKAIGWSLEKHHEVLELIQWSKDNDHFGLNMNIGDFVGSKMWISIKDHKDGSNAITFDTMTSI